MNYRESRKDRKKKKKKKKMLCVIDISTLNKTYLNLNPHRSTSGLRVTLSYLPLGRRAKNCQQVYTVNFILQKWPFRILAFLFVLLHNKTYYRNNIVASRKITWKRKPTAIFQNLNNAIQQSIMLKYTTTKTSFFPCMTLALTSYCWNLVMKNNRKCNEESLNS